jgi:hypothetical protein
MKMFAPFTGRELSLFLYFRAGLEEELTLR